MKGFFRLVLSIAIVIVSVTGCSSEKLSTGPKKEVVAYEEKLITHGSNGELEIICDYCNVVIYSWNKPDIKLEATKRLRGNFEKEILEEKIQHLKIDISKKNENAVLRAEYKGRNENAADRELELKLHVPKKIKKINFMVDNGTIKVMDDMKCDFNFKTKAVKVEINRFAGKLTYRSSEGSIDLRGGKLKKGSFLFSDRGNISIKSELEQEDTYTVETLMGNIDVQLPYNLDVSAECIGNTEVNEFAGKASATKMKIQSGIGRISVTKYLQ